MSAEYENFNSNEILIPVKTQNFIAVKLQQNKTRDPSVDGNRRLQAACSHLLMGL